MGPVTTVITLGLRKQGEGMVSITWRKIALWRGATLREAVTFNWMEGYCQTKMTFSERDLESKYPNYPFITLPYSSLQYPAGFSVGPTKQKDKRHGGGHV